LYKEIHYDIYLHVCTIYLSYIYPPPLFSLFPLLRIISTCFILLFSYMNTNYLHHIHSFLMPTPLPLVPTPRNDLFYSSVLHFLKVYIDGSRGFHLSISDMHIYCYNQINASITHSFSITMLPIQQLMVQYIRFLCRWDVSIFFIL
jgi:hypothetical protein